MSASLPLRMRLSVSVTGAQHKDADRRRVSVRGCASPAGLPPDVRGAPYPVKEVAPVAQARRDRSGRANRGRSSTQGVAAWIAERKVGEEKARHATVFDDVQGRPNDHGRNAIGFEVAGGQTHGLVALSSTAINRKSLDCANP